MSTLLFLSSVKGIVGGSKLVAVFKLSLVDPQTFARFFSECATVALWFLILHRRPGVHRFRGKVQFVAIAQTHRDLATHHWAIHHQHPSPTL
jgi:hypothetical protein